MPLRVLGSALLVVAVAAVPARAGFHQVTLGGTVTEVDDFPGVNVGDSFTLRYIASDEDQDPSPTFGRYAASAPVATFPSTVVHFPGQPWSPIRVSSNNPDRSDGIAYSHLGPNSGHLFSVSFPTGTLPDDALPLTLPMSLATGTNFVVYRFSTIIGTLSSYESTEVPEPAAAGLLLLGSALTSRRIARIRACANNTDKQTGRLGEHKVIN